MELNTDGTEDCDEEKSKDWSPSSLREDDRHALHSKELPVTHHNRIAKTKCRRWAYLLDIRSICLNPQSTSLEGSGGWWDGDPPPVLRIEHVIFTFLPFDSQSSESYSVHVSVQMSNMLACVAA